MRRAARQDSNHVAVATEFRRLGIATRNTHMVGDGFPDLICACKHGTWLVEIKDGAKSPSRRTLTSLEALFAKFWPQPIYRVETLADVPAVILDACRDCNA